MLTSLPNNYRWEEEPWDSNHLYVVTWFRACHIKSTLLRVTKLLKGPEADICIIGTRMVAKYSPQYKTLEDFQYLWAPGFKETNRTWWGSNWFAINMMKTDYLESPSSICRKIWSPKVREKVYFWIYILFLFSIHLNLYFLICILFLRQMLHITNANLKWW